MLRRLEPLHANVGKRLVKSPRICVADSGLLHARLGLENAAALAGHPAIGASWEGFVLEQIASSMQRRNQCSFYRTAAGAEVDVVVERNGRRLAFEIKYSAAPKPTKGFWLALADLRVDRAYVVAPVRQAYALAENADVVPAHRLGELLA